MTFDNWIYAVNKAMRKHYGLAISDTGYTEKEFFARFGNQRPLDAVLAFGEKYASSSSKNARGPASWYSTGDTNATSSSRSLKNAVSATKRSTVEREW